MSDRAGHMVAEAIWGVAACLLFTLGVGLAAIILIVRLDPRLLVVAAWLTVMAVGLQIDSHQHRTSYRETVR